MIVRSKTYTALAGAIALAASAAQAQAQDDDGRLSAAAPAPATTPAVPDPDHAPASSRVSELLGSAVRTRSDGEVGEIEDLIVADGEIVSADISFGGILSIGGETVNVPYSDLRRDGDGFIVERLGAVGVGTAGKTADRDKLRPEPVVPLQIDAELAEIDPRLAEGIAASEQAFGEKLDHESHDNDAEPEGTPKPSANSR